MNNILLIHPYVQNYVSNLLNNKISQDTVYKINIISDLYDNVFLPLCKDYEELPLEYNNTNYVLKQTIDIISHCLKHTLLTSMYHSIVKTITKYVKSINPPPNNNVTTSLKYDDIQYSEFINKSVESILVTENNNQSSLIKYIFDFLPLKLVKITMNIFDGDSDPDRIYNRDDLYEKILKIIMLNTSLPLSDNSSLIKNMKEILIPYFKDFNELFINEAKILVDGYFGYLISESNLLKILSILLNQSLKELDYN